MGGLRDVLPLIGGGSLENLDRHSREFLRFMRELSF